jgi:hypothetical protein
LAYIEGNTREARVYAAQGGAKVSEAPETNRLKVYALTGTDSLRPSGIHGASVKTKVEVRR